MQPDFTQLIAASRDGQQAATNELFDRYYNLVRRCVHKGLDKELRPSRPWLGAMFSTGDVVQEVFLSVLRDLDTFAGDSEQQFISFLATVTKSRLVDAIRFHEAFRRDPRRVHRGAEPDQIGSSKSDPLEDAVSGEEVARFCSALSGLREREQLLLRRRLEDNEQFNDLADALGYPTGDAARKAFHVAQARLATRVAALEGDDTRS